MSYRPSPEVLLAVSQALQLLQPHWPRNLAMASDSSAAGIAFLSGYCQACIGADLDAIPEAATQWLAHEQFAPKPSQLGKLAREITRARPGRDGAFARDTGPAEPLPRPEHADDIEALSRKAYAVLRGWSQVAQCWSVAWEEAQTESERDQVRTGRIPANVWDLFIGQVDNGRVARTVGPLAREMTRGAA